MTRLVILCVTILATYVGITFMCQLHALGAARGCRESGDFHAACEKFRVLVEDVYPRFFEDQGDHGREACLADMADASLAQGGFLTAWKHAESVLEPPETGVEVRVGDIQSRIVRLHADHVRQLLSAGYFEEAKEQLGQMWRTYPETPAETERMYYRACLGSAANLYGSGAFGACRLELRPLLTSEAPTLVFTDAANLYLKTVEHEAITLMQQNRFDAMMDLLHKEFARFELLPSIQVKLLDVRESLDLELFGEKRGDEMPRPIADPVPKGIERHDSPSGALVILRNRMVTRVSVKIRGSQEIDLVLGPGEIAELPLRGGIYIESVLPAKASCAGYATFALKSGIFEQILTDT